MKKNNFYPKIFQANFTYLVESKRYTKIYLSEALKLSRQTIDKIIAGESTMSIEEAINLANLYDIDYHKLFFESLAGDNVLNDPPTEYLKTIRPKQIDFGIAKMINHHTLEDYVWVQDNDSMEPLITKDDLVIITKHHGDQYDPVKPYLIEMANSLIIGYIQKLKEGLIINQSNKLFVDVRILEADIKQVYRVIKVVKSINI